MSNKNRWDLDFDYQSEPEPPSQPPSQPQTGRRLQNMSYQVTGTQEVKINISERELINLCIEMLRKKYDLPRYSYVKGGNIWHTVEYYILPPLADNEFYREAKPEDQVVADMIKLLSGGKPL